MAPEELPEHPSVQIPHPEGAVCVADAAGCSHECAALQLGASDEVRVTLEDSAGARACRPPLVHLAASPVECPPVCCGPF